MAEPKFSANHVVIFNVYISLACTVFLITCKSNKFTQCKADQFIYFQFRTELARLLGDANSCAVAAQPKI